MNRAKGSHKRPKNNGKNLNYTKLFLSLAPTIESGKYFQEISSYAQTIRFKTVAVDAMYWLVQNQEFKLFKKYNETKSETRDYREETVQMAYLDAFLSAVYSLTENVANITRYFYKDLPFHFHKQADKIIKNPKISPELSELLRKQRWYDVFREVRAESTHFGSAFLIWDNSLGNSNAHSWLAIEPKSKRENKILTGNLYSFDFRNVPKIYEGINSYIEGLAKILIKTIDPNIIIPAAIVNKQGGFKKQKNIKLEDVLKGREKITFLDNISFQAFRNLTD